MSAETPFRNIPKIANPHRSKYGNMPNINIMTKDERKTFYGTLRKRDERAKKASELSKYVLPIDIEVYTIFVSQRIVK